VFGLGFAAVVWADLLLGEKVVINLGLFFGVFYTFDEIWNAFCFSGISL
jgi:hypothetical protein